MLANVNAIREQNPMLGLRGCRLGILYPEINAMQVQAIFRAAVKLADEGVEVLPGDHDPARRIRDGADVPAQRCSRRRRASEMESSGKQVKYQFGTMIELPRAALTAGEIAKTAEFFSFGTNDLTQTTLGCSRDDAEGQVPRRSTWRWASSSATRSSRSTRSASAR